MTGNTGQENGYLVFTSTVMAQTFSCILLLLSLCAAFGKYVYIEQYKTWPEAQQHCRLFHTDLAPVSNRYDIRRLHLLIDEVHNFIWFGLMRDPTDHDKWLWSGGGAVSTFFWEQWQPNNRLNEDYGFMRDYEWYDASPGYLATSLCYSAVLVQERKTWEEALVYCRERHNDLASVASDTEMLLIQKELGKNDTTERVWIGLHFFPEGWLWVDGQPLDYEAWGQEGRPECPDVKLHCGALQVMAAPGTDPSDVAGVDENVWQAYDCAERLHFICY